MVGGFPSLIVGLAQLRVVMMATLAALEVVVMTTSRATSDEVYVKVYVKPILSSMAAPKFVVTNSDVVSDDKIGVITILGLHRASRLSGWIRARLWDNTQGIVTFDNTHSLAIFLYPFHQGHGCHTPNDVHNAVSTFNHLPRMFLSTDFAFWITDWTCCHGPYLHAILRIISRGVSGLATDSPCGVWGRGWTTCLLHDSPLFGSHFKMRVGM